MAVEAEIEGVADMLREDGGASCSGNGNRCNRERDRYFGDEDEFIGSRDEEIPEQEWIDVLRVEWLPNCRRVVENPPSENLKDIEDAECAEYCAYRVSRHQGEATGVLGPGEMKVDKFVTSLTIVNDDLK